MPTAVQQYTDEIHDELGYWATWLPGTKLSLGHCGRIRDRTFTPETSLSEFGLEVADLPAESPIDIQHATHGAVSYRVEGKAENKTIPQVPPGSAGIELSFSRDNAVVLIARNAVQHRLANVPALEASLNQLADAGKFDREMAVITHLIVADSATILISSGSQSRIALSAEADLTAGLLDLANASVSLSRVSASGMQTEIVAAHGLTPLFKLVGFRRRGIFLGRRSAGRLEFEEDAAPASLSELEPGDTD